MCVCVCVCDKSNITVYIIGPGVRENLWRLLEVKWNNFFGRK